MKSPFLNLLLVICVGCSSFSAKAADLVFPSGVQNITGTAVIAYTVDDKLGQYANTDFYTHEVKNRITVSIDRHNLKYAVFASVIDVQLKIYGKELIGGTEVPFGPIYKTVRLEYDAAKGATEIDKAVLTFDNYVESTAEVNAITVVSGPVTTYPDPQLPDLQLVNNIYIDRTFALDLAAIDVTNLGISAVYPNAVNKDQMIKMTWPAVDGAEGYEVEFLFIDDPVAKEDYAGYYGYYIPPLPTHIHVDQYLIDFSHNATRIKVSDGNSLEIPIVFPEGYVVFRVRALGHTVDANRTHRESRWSLPDLADVSLYNLTGDCALLLENYNANINWMHTLSYTEEAKYGSVLTWYDGMLRRRETVTIDNETQLPIVHANVFDYLGLETVQVPSSPFFDNKGYDFRAKVNQNNSGDAYSYQDFDLNHSTTDELKVNPMSNVSGANHYYSSAFNTYLSSSSYDDHIKRRHSFLPDAEGYAFTQQELTNDPSGRVARSGGIGKAHQLTAYHSGALEEGHETKSWDATPFQDELDRLFASEVGPYYNYKKVMSQDANGQLSIAYVDLFGRTVATALAGDPANTPNLDALASSSDTFHNRVTLENVEVDRFNKIMNHSFLVTQKDTWSFTYDFYPQSANFECDTNFCYECAYELELSLKDRWGNEVFDSGPLVYQVGQIEDSLQCGEAISWSNPAMPLKIELDPGEYTLTKRLTLNTQSIKENREIFLAQSGCIKPFSDFLAEEIIGMDLTCEISCEECDLELIDLFIEMDSIRQWCLANSEDTMSYTPYLIVKKEYNQVSQYCLEICDQLANPCTRLYNEMLRDVSLGGQYMTYFTIDPDSGSVNGDLDDVSSSILKEGTWWTCSGNERNWRTPDHEGDLYYKNEDGSESLIKVVDGYPEIKSSASYVTIDGKQYAKPHELEHVSDFIKYWQESWAKSLVYMHPEYCYYLKCDAIKETYDYDNLLMSTSDAEEALDKGFFNPLDQSYLGAMSFLTGSPHIDYSADEVNPQRDPILTTTFATSSSPSPLCNDPSNNIYNCADRLKYNLSNYTIKIPNNSGGCDDRTATIWELYEEYRDQSGASVTGYGNDTCVNDLFWPALRAMYMAVKADWLTNYYAEECPNGTACSGNTPTSLIKTRRWAGASSVDQMLTEIDPTWGNLRDLCQHKDIANKVNEKVNSICEDHCTTNVEMWISRLENCSKITNLSGTELTELKDDLKLLCLSGCDIDNPYGSVTRSLKNRYNSNYPFQNLHDVFVKHLGQNWFTEGICDDLLIDFPGSYGHDYLATDDPEALDCVCDSVKWETTTACPDLIVQDSVENCACSYPHDLAVAGAVMRGVQDDQKCKNCIVCKDMMKPVKSFLERYEEVDMTENPFMYQSMLTTLLNRHFGFNLVYQEYEEFAMNCLDSTAGDSTWLSIWHNVGMNRLVSFNELNPNGSFLDIGGLASTSNRLTTKSIDIDHAAGKVVLKVDDLSKLFNAKFTSSNPDILLTVNDVANVPRNMEVTEVQSLDADKIACHCEKILKVGHMIDNGQGGGLTPELLYDQFFAPETWPTGWVFNDMKLACCKMWNLEPAPQPLQGPCDPIGYEPGKTFDPGQKTHIDNELADPNHAFELDYFGDDPCTNDPPPSTLAKNYLDTCACKELKTLEEDYHTDPNGSASGKTLEAYVLFIKGFAIDDIEDLLEACREMWETGERKDGNGNSINLWNSTSNWSNIGNENLEEYAFDKNWKVNESLICDYIDTCYDIFPCALLTNRLMTLAGRLSYIIEPYDPNDPNDPVDKHYYADPNQLIGRLYDLMATAEELIPGDSQKIAIESYLQHLKDSLNLTFAKCPNNKEYSLDLYIRYLQKCHKPKGDPPCIDQLFCDSIGLAYKEFLDSFPNPQDPNFTAANNRQYASALGDIYDVYSLLGTDTTNDDREMLDWLDSLQTNFNERFNRCYDSTEASKVSLDEMLRWIFLCDSISVKRKRTKPDPCPKCYVGDTTFLNGFGLFLDHVTNKQDPNYLHQTLWSLEGASAGPYDFPEFYNNPLYYSNGHQSDLEYIAHSVKVPELDVTITDNNGYELSFTLAFPTGENKWNFGEILEFIEINPIASGGCRTPNLFEAVAVYNVPNKYWGEYLNCPNNISGTECHDTISLYGRFKNTHFGIEVPCPSCARLCNKPFLRPFRKERCHTRDLRLAFENALIRYSNYLTGKIAEFDSTYIAQCMGDSLKENMEIEYIDNLYHYTLYHYDRAGNLIKTVPPAGVDFANESLNLSQKQAILSDRLEKTKAWREDPINNSRPYTFHTLATRYKYNSLSAQIWQSTPDGGESRIWYDGLARIVLAQNANQASEDVFSYILYDELGRTVESGEIDPVGSSTNIVTDDVVNSVWLAGLLASNSSGDNKKEVTRTQFDEGANTTRSAPAFTDIGGPQNLRNVVASVTFEKVNDDDPETYDYAAYYSYDALGNINRYVQDIPLLENVEYHLFTIDYEYDLLSGNMNSVSYQKGKVDQYFHRYSYDANNRLKEVHTSDDNYTWERDARYEFYFHGALARKELGELDVQGIDYNYTIHGWLKGINSATINPAEDIGQDGYVTGTNVHEEVARDAFAFDLSYYDSDYKPIHGGAYGPTIAGSDVEDYSSELFNGNISRMTTSIAKEADYSATSDIVGDIMANVYRYDQLHRITKHRVFQNYDPSLNQWNYDNYDGTGKYYESFGYDASGNIKHIERHGENGTTVQMDDFTYQYDYQQQSGAGQTWDALVSNKLYHVNDAINAGNYGHDLDDQGSFSSTNINTSNNYGFDKLGNLVRDDQNDIEEITWNLLGKIESVRRTSGSPLPDLEFGYTARGNRLFKIVKPKDPGAGYALMSNQHWIIEYYISGPSGTLIATYKTTYSEVSGHYREHLTLNQHVIYGSSRLGLENQNIEINSREFDAAIGAQQQFELTDYSPYSLVHVTQLDLELSYLERGEKQYELTNHLGNVLTTISDRHLPKDDNSDNITDYYVPYITTAVDYYAFGSAMHGRGFIVSGGSYRYGFNGQEQDGEMTHSGEVYAFEMRMYNAQLGRFFTRDPLEHVYVGQSTYVFAHNSPIALIDWKGMGDPPPTREVDGCVEVWADYEMDGEGAWVDIDDYIYDEGKLGEAVVTAKKFHGITIYGANNSSVRLATEVLDIKITLPSKFTTDFGGNYTFEGDELLVTMLDIAGIFDQTGVADAASASIQFANGNIMGGILSGIGTVPIFGDVGKIFKIGKYIKTIKKFISAIRKGKKAANAVGAFSSFKYASKYGIDSYKALRKAVKADNLKGVEVHHLIEKRFAAQMGEKAKDMASVVLTKEEHKVFTKAWRDAIPYGSGTANATKEQIEEIAKSIYADYPEILSKLGL